MQRSGIRLAIKSLAKRAALQTGFMSLMMMMRRRQHQGCRVVNFHRVLADGTPQDYYARWMGEPTLAELRRILKQLQRWFRFIRPAEYLEMVARDGRVEPFTMMLTLDDGHIDFHNRLLPLVEELRVPATVFINTAAMDGQVMWFQRLFSAVVHSPLSETPLGFEVAPMSLRTVRDRVKAIGCFAARNQRIAADDWDDEVSRVCDAFRWDGELRDERMMSWDQLDTLSRSKWITIGGHTANHPYLPQCDERRLESELVECASVLRRRYDRDQIPFSYPGGGCNGRVVEQVRRAGYSSGFLMSRGLNTVRTDPYRLFRQYVGTTAAEASFDMIFRSGVDAN